MTAMNVLITDDAAHLFTDGAAFDLDTGKIDAIGSKPFAFPHLNAVIMATGYQYVNTLLQIAVMDARVKNFDELAEHFGAIVHKAIKDAKTLSPSIRKWGFFETIIVGWSSSMERPTAYAMKRNDFGMLSVKPSIIRKGSSITPRLAEGIPEFAGDIENYAVGVMEAQRRTLMNSRDLNDSKMELHAIGGFCQHTMVTSDAITMRILKYWPDVIGESIFQASDSSSTLF